MVGRLGLLIGLVACSEPNPDFCDGNNDCSDGRVCDLTANSCVEAPPNPNWVRQANGSGRDSVDATAIALDGSVYVAGTFDEMIDLGGGPLVATGVSDIYVGELTSLGEHVWSKRFGGSATSLAIVRDMRMLSNGDVVVSGEYEGSLTLGSTPLTSVGNRDVFVTRLTSTGDVVWAVTGGTTNRDEITGLAVDADDNLAVCGALKGSGEFFATTISASTTSNDVWLVRLTGAGLATWATQAVVDDGDDHCGGTGMTATGDVVVVGDFKGMVTVGGPTFTSLNGTRDFYIARYDAATGAHVWSKQQGGLGDDVPHDVATHGTSIVVTGEFDGSVGFGGAVLTTAGGNDAFVASFDDADGGHELSARIGGVANDSGKRLAVRGDGTIALVGEFGALVTFGDDTFTSAGLLDAFVVELDGTSGVLRTALSIGGGGADTATAVAETGNALVAAGSFASAITVLDETLQSTGPTDGYVVHLTK